METFTFQLLNVHVINEVQQTDTVEPAVVRHSAFKVQMTTETMKRKMTKFRCA